MEAIRRWWNGAGHGTYPHARRLLIAADAGGSNGYRTRAWRTELAALAAQTALASTVCHFPPGTSKWNPIEHRLVSHTTMNWRGRPLIGHEVVVQHIAATTTRTGLHVHAELDTGQYAAGVAISNHQMANLPVLARRLVLFVLTPVSSGTSCRGSWDSVPGRPVGGVWPSGTRLGCGTSCSRCCW